MGSKFLTAQQLADKLNISLSSSYRLISECHFEALKIKGCVRVSEQSVDDFIRRKTLLFAVEQGLRDAPD